MTSQMESDVVVVGAGLAGVRTAQELRGQGHEGRLVVVGAAGFGGAMLAIEADCTSWVGCACAPAMRMVWRPYSS